MTGTAPRPVVRRGVNAVVFAVVLALTACGGEDGSTGAEPTDHPGHGGGSTAPTTQPAIERIRLDCASDDGPVDPADMAEVGSPRLIAEPCTHTPERAAHLEAEVARVRAAIAPFPTVADALAAGFVFETPPDQAPDGPIHLYRLGRIDDRIDLDEPEMLMYAGSEPDAPLITAVYWLPAPITTKPPTGFTGPEDRWHFHATDHRACVLGGSIRSELDEAACRGAGGRWVSGEGWMLHVWAVPERPNPDGIFTLDHPEYPAGIGHDHHGDG